MFLIDGVGSEGNSLDSRTIKNATVSIRLAEERDVGELRRLIEASVLGLQAGDYSPAQLKRALQAVYGVDTQLIADGNYFVAEARAEEKDNAEKSTAPVIVGLRRMEPAKNLLRWRSVDGARGLPCWIR